MPGHQIKNLVIFLTVIFLMAPVFLLVFTSVYNKRKKRYQEEKAQMKLTFEAEISRAQLEMQEQTMQTIGADLHDNIGQLLGLTSLTLGSIEETNLAQSQHKINTAIDLTKQSIKEMRLLGKLLQGDQLIAQGLNEAIVHEINWIEKSELYKVIYSQHGQAPLNKNSDKDLILFRILQEAVNNIIKHAHATQISIKLIYQDTTLELQVSDNGAGFYMDSSFAQQKGMGLLNIQKRATIVGGEATIKSTPGKGTCINIFIPYP